VTLKTHADLDGLGASEGALITWPIPANLPGNVRSGFPGRRSSADGFPARRRGYAMAVGMAAQPVNAPSAARSGINAASWLKLGVVLCLAILLVRGRRGKAEG